MPPPTPSSPAKKPAIAPVATSASATESQVNIVCSNIVVIGLWFVVLPNSWVFVVFTFCLFPSNISQCYLIRSDIMNLY
jgi:hypothetical protein